MSSDVKKHVYIHIGEFHASSQPTVIQTLLGSCVGVCLFDPKSRIGGLNHILLPVKPDLRRFDASARYGINAMELLINRIINLGGDRSQLIAKAFGGAHLLSAIPYEKGVGKANIAFVTEFLQSEGIKLVNKDLGGINPRKILFHTDNGQVFLKRFKPVEIKETAIVEQKRLKIVNKEIEKSGDVTLF